MRKITCLPVTLAPSLDAGASRSERNGASPSDVGCIKLEIHLVKLKDKKIENAWKGQRATAASFENAVPMDSAKKSGCHRVR
jgi:hypothetical protein